MPRRQQKTSAKMIRAAETAPLAVDLRRSGMTYREIADELDISAATAFKHVKKALESAAARTRESSDAMIELELQRLDQMLIALWDNASAGDVAAIDRVIKLMERRAKLLGLDAPTKTENKTEAEVTARGGVLAVPMPMDLEEWARSAKEYQAKLIGNINESDDMETTAR